MNIWTDMQDFFFPRTCLICGKRLLHGENGVCLACLSSLPYTHLNNTVGNAMERCFWGKFPIRQASSLFYYAKDGAVAQILYAMKYYNRQRLCVQMGELIAARLLPTGFFNQIDILLPVPLSRARLKKRGYNQSELLAKGISNVIHLPVSKGAILRSRDNVSQTHKSSYARWENADSLFVVGETAPDLKGKHVLLIDDVLTTGATLVACADALREIEDIQISVLTLAWAK